MTFKSSHSSMQVSEELVTRKENIVPGNIAVFDTDGKIIDSGFVAGDVDLTDYYTKTETYSSTEINDLLDAESDLNIKLDGSSPPTTGNIRLGIGQGFGNPDDSVSMLTFPSALIFASDDFINFNSETGNYQFGNGVVETISLNLDDITTPRIITFQDKAITVAGLDDIPSPLTNTDSLTEGVTNKYFTAARVLAVSLTGYVLGTATAILASDTILQAFGKIEARLNENAASLLTKLTQGGDSPASTLRAGTNNAQSFAVRTNGVDRLVTDASGNTVQQGSSSLFDIVKLRIRNTTGVFFEVFSSSVTNVLTFASGWVEINFTGGWTALKGIGSRMTESDANGVQSAVEEIVSLKIYNPTVWGLLSDGRNWSKANVYIGTSLASYTLSQGIYYADALYEYTMDSTLIPIRKARYRIARRLYNDYVLKGNLMTATDTYTYTIPSNTLNKNGDCVKIRFKIIGFSVTSEFTPKLNGMDIYSATSTGLNEHIHEINIIRTNNNSQTIDCLRIDGGSYPTPLTTFLSLTDTSDIVFTVSTQGSGSNNLYACLFEVDFKPAI